MASGRLADYLGKGDSADRPVAPDLHPEAIGFYFAEDTGEWSAWDGSAWLEDIMAGGGGGIPDAPSDGTLYGRKDGNWEAVAGSAVDSVNGKTGVVVLDADDVGACGTGYSIITEASAFTADPGVHDGLGRYIRAGGDVTFDSAEPYSAGMVFNIRATATLELVGTGVTLTPPSGGTLDMEAGMAVQVVMTGATTGDVIGQTVAA